MNYRTKISRVMSITGLLCAGIIANNPSAQVFHKANSFDQKDGKDLIYCHVKRSDRGDFTVKYSLADMKTEKDKKLNDGSVSVFMGSAPISAKVGAPMLPVIPLKLILAPGTTVSSVDVLTGQRKEILGNYRVIHNMGYVPLKTDNKEDGPAKADESIYSQDKAFPYETHELVTIQKKRGVTIAFININPVRYIPKSGQIYSYDSIEVHVKTEDCKKISPLRSNAAKVNANVLGVENPEEIESYSGADAEKKDGSSLAVYDYLIVTGQNIIDASTDYTIRDLAAHRESRGQRTVIRAIEDILADYPGVDNAEKLRNFLIESYNTWDISYVLLGGDINIIPMRKLYCTASSDVDHIPSDLYYQCLDGTYNSDGDANWGETNDGEGGGDIDLLSEIHIGRVSAQNAAEMSNFVYKTIAYETSNPEKSYLRNALMCGEHLGFGGVSEYAKNSMEEIRLGSSANGYTTAGFAQSESFTVGTLYDADDSNNDWPVSTLIDLINSNTYSIINHLGHANSNYVMKLYNRDADAFTNTNYIFAYSQGCIPGNFESDCIAEHMTTSNRNGMYAVVFNSRYGWGSRNSTNGPSQKFDRQFWDAYFSENMWTLGELNSDSHEDNIYNINGPCIRWCFYETNLMGDPAVIMRGKYTGPVISYSSHNITEIQGNNDGFVSPGEEISLNVSLENSGIITAVNTKAMLGTANTNVIMVNNNASYGDISSGEIKPAISPFVIRISPNCPTPATVVFTMAVTDDSGNSWNTAFDIEILSVGSVNGLVSSYTGNNPVSGAEISYRGKVTGRIITDENGVFLLNLPQGEYSLTASDVNYIQSDTVRVVIPLNDPVNIYLRRPELVTGIQSINTSTLPGVIKDTLLTITNDGDYDLNIDLIPTYSEDTISAKYDSSHFIVMEKGAKDLRIGNPVKTNFGGPDGYGYQWRVSEEFNGPQYEWNDISDTGTLLGISSRDDSYQLVELGFPFKFYENIYDTAYVSTNGYITFGRGSSEWENYPLPGLKAPLNLIAGFYTDLNPEYGGNIYFQTWTDKAIIQYNDVRFYSGTGAITFQIVLYKSGKICFYYKEITGNSQSSTAGIQNSLGNMGLEIVYNSSYLRTGLAIEIINNARWISINQTNDVIPPGETRNYTLSLGNAELEKNIYNGSILISNNDPRHKEPVVIPVVLNVTDEVKVPEIQVNPQNQTVIEYQSVTFSVVASGSDLQYQWLRDGNEIEGATQTDYTLLNVGNADNGARFSCVVSNNAGSIESDKALLTVITLEPPVITVQPLSQRVLLGEVATFSIVATGTDLSYRWFKDQVEIEGAMGPVVIIDSISLIDNGSSFVCTVSNAAGRVSSNQAFLTVLEKPVYRAEATRIGISSQSTMRTEDYKVKGLLIGSSCAGKMSGSRFIYYVQ